MGDVIGDGEPEKIEPAWSPRILGISAIKDFTTYLQFNKKSREYRGYLAGREAYEKTYAEKLFKAAKELFLDFVSPYLSAQGISLQKRLSSEEEIIFTGKNRLELFGEEKEILPGDMRSKEFRRLGYQPRLVFTTTPNKISVKSFLDKSPWTDNNDGLEPLEDLLLETLWRMPEKNPKPEIDIIDKPYSAIKIASIEDVPKVLKALKKIYEHVGMFEYENLLEIKKAMKSEDSKGYALMILEEGYENEIKGAAPKRFSF